VIAMTLAEIAAIVGGAVSPDDADTVVSGPAFVDSRSPISGGLYVAIEGERVDGHDYAAPAVRAGAAAALVRRRADVPCVVVSDPVVAIGQLAAHVRAALVDVAVVGITGSQGKTSTKDLIGQVLAAAGPTIATAGSLNNEIGTPLTVLRADSSTRFLVVEMGARGRGHIHYLAGMAKPSVGAVLNVGVAHIGEFGSQAAIAVAKGELVEALPASGVAVLNRDDPLVDAMRARTTARVVTFGSTADCDVRFVDPRLGDDGQLAVALEIDGSRHELALSLVGLHQASNVAAAAATALACGMSVEAVLAALASVRPQSRWRMELSETPAGVVVLNDAYNANPDSMRAALQTLADLGRRKDGSRLVAVLGEMRELGDAADEAHRAVGGLAASLGVDLLVVVGEQARQIHHGALGTPGWSGQALWAADAASASTAVASAVRPGDVVLVKASRAAGLERVGEDLLATTTGPTAEREREADR
jgi:UDP-N-acetylmuramoyl-tripeptide--D-alanyl-D-alanine ligase